MYRFSKAWTEWKKAHPKEYKMLSAKHTAKQRGLGYIPLNESFEGSIAHHMDKTHVAYIPKELHDSVPHSVRTGENMQEINDRVFAWLESQFAKGETPK